MTQPLSPEESLLAYKCQNTDCGFYFVQKVGWGTFYCPRCKYTTRPIFDYYRMFGIEGEFDLAQLKERYKRLSLHYHPDQSKNEFSEDFLAIRKGYELLSDETEKEIYDQELILFRNFMEGKPPPQENKVASGNQRGWVILFLMGGMLFGLVFYQWQNYYYSSFILLLWATVCLIWQETVLKVFYYLVEVGIVAAVGYTLYRQKWVETLILLLGLVIYMMIKRKKSTG